MKIWRPNIIAFVIAPVLMTIVAARAAHGTDSYNPVNGQLTIPTVAICATTNSNVVVTVSLPLLAAPSGNPGPPSAIR